GAGGAGGSAGVALKAVGGARRVRAGVGAVAQGHDRGTDEDRPAFQRMITMAAGPGRPFDVALVHSTSRFARDLYVNEMYVRRLRKAGVELGSITQDISGRDGSSEVLRQMLAVFDEHQSRENAKHTHRAMRENARQGFWNGSRPPFGYRTVEAGRQGH